MRAVFDQSTITVYQAYSPAIAAPAVAAKTFVAPFKLERMTWIKPSFLWMMYRSGWGAKGGQERILSIRITRAGFEEALSLACLSHFDPDVYADYETWVERKLTSPVRVQWDPERSTALQPLPWRSLQVGLGGVAARRYVNDWVTDITDITDITEHAHDLRHLARQASDLLPPEMPYPLPPNIATNIGAAI
ncbi:DUF4291 domain-containing protein [Tenggerimyces flavus]|uniref:DUF4291 domain-containing protein n=1 Tax=Tenggerimyces flavus TaxID=1708749 RepID=A0ABV7YF54_9ACTN|nr:DUF4291 domain-containing protein [Tenggerimyces flavus]MBM7789140.1 hypothetical protein [Tenggerimyces flavus]